MKHNNAQWQAANNARSAIYRWFADVYTKEFTTANLADLQVRYTALHQAFTGLGLDKQSSRLQKAIDSLKDIPESDRALELAADFAQMFLLSGRDSAPPYASYYLEADKMLYGKPAKLMGDFLSNHDLSLHPDFREPKDHISVYLQVMHLWIKSSLNKFQDDNAQNHVSLAQEQIEFLDNALLNWLPKFSERCQTIRVKTDIYPALSVLLLGFIQKDKEGLNELLCIRLTHGVQ